jgi:hypothetical protein
MIETTKNTLNMYLNKKEEMHKAYFANPLPKEIGSNEESERCQLGQLTG